MILQVSGLPGKGMTYPVMDYQNFLWRLILALSDLRLAGDSPSVAWYEVRSLISRGQGEGFLSVAQVGRLEVLAHNALNHSPDLRFPDERNAGPYMPTSEWFKRHKAELAAESMTGVIHMPGYYVVDPVHGKSQTLWATNEKSEPVPAPTSRRELRLLCLLAKPQLDTAQGAYLPIHTMHRLPPRAMVRGQWSQPRYAGLHLRETQARQPSAAVLARCERHRQTNAFRAAARTVRTGGVIA